MHEFSRTPEIFEGIEGGQGLVDEYGGFREKVLDMILPYLRSEAYETLDPETRARVDASRAAKANAPAAPAPASAAPAPAPAPAPAAPAAGLMTPENATSDQVHAVLQSQYLQALSTGDTSRAGMLSSSLRSSAQENVAAHWGTPKQKKSNWFTRLFHRGK